MRIRNGMTIAALAALLAPAALSGQEQQIPAEAQELMMELREIQTELQPVQQQALRDPAIQQGQQQLAMRLRDAMIAEDPSLESQMQRLSTLQAEAQAAQAEQNQERMAQIIREVQQVQQQVQAVQQRVMTQPEVEAEISRYQQALERKMLEVDADVAPLLERFKEIDRELAEMLGRPGAF